MILPVNCQHPNVIGSPKSIIFWLLLLITFAPASRAEDGSDDTNSLLENLKRRTAEERWDRLKKQYPTNPTAPRRTAPAQLPADSQQAQQDVDVPPSPGPTMLIPRIAALPEDHTNDWVIPTRPVPTDDEEPPAFSDAQPANSASIDDQDSSASPTTTRVAAQETTVQPQNAQVESPAYVPQRALHDRKINEIAPYYDRDTDSDIRKFAVEKGRELDMEFRPKPYPPRSFPEIVLAWEATNFSYHPLYFNDSSLERYGHSHHPVLQPLFSIARVGAQFVFFPYQATILPPNKEEYPLGYYRPGDVIPKLHYQVPLNAEAAAVEAGVVTGLYFFIVP